MPSLDTLKELGIKARRHKESTAAQTTSPYLAFTSPQGLGQKLDSKPFEDKDVPLVAPCVRLISSYVVDARECAMVGKYSC